MLKEHSSFIKQLIALLDCLLIFGAFYLATFITIPGENPFNVMFKNWFVFIGFLVFYLYFAWTRSLFSVLHFSWMTGLFSRIVMIFVSAGLFGAAILYLFPRIVSSRVLYVTFISLSFLFIVTEKLFLTFIITFIRKHGKNITPVFLIGRGRELSLLHQEIKANPGLGIRVIKKMDIVSTPLKEFENILKNTHVEEIFFSIPRRISKNGFSIDPYLQICEEMGRP
ncbi:MAG: hypothetical protein N2053_11375, partial [Chitinispirillaceae bacterium]|nr:hypothetical protein [Chitinispirillaceae bacterium]